MDKMKKLFYGIMISVVVVLCMYVFFCASCTTSITIEVEHKWEEEGTFYFSDQYENVYQMSCGTMERKYSNLKRVRYDKLEVGEKYVIVHCCDVCTVGELRLSYKEIKM